MDLYSYVFRGLVTEEALDKAGRKNKHAVKDAELGKQFTQLGIADMDEVLVSSASNSSVVYIAIHAFENTVRSFITKKLQEEKGTDWWSESVKKDIRTRAENRRDIEQAIRWHSARGENLIDYTDFGDLISIIAGNWSLFEPHITSIDWAKEIIGTLEKSRNVIMHGGVLKETDTERVGMYIRDWLRQVGS
ncbi:MAG TPA: Swt1 family HEPN domain-containing protein [Bacillota bacterium]|nr:Swt1 family HEPN domain-containing protein [Bacillota bacterium]